MHLPLQFMPLSLKNSKWVWSGKPTITSRRQTHGTVRKSHTTIARHQKAKLSKAANSLFPIKMIAKLEWMFSHWGSLMHLQLFVWGLYRIFFCLLCWFGTCDYIVNVNISSNFTSYRWVLHFLMKVKCSTQQEWARYNVKGESTESKDLNTVVYIQIVYVLALLSRRLIGELIVYQWLQRPSIRRPATFSNIFSSETTGPIELIFHMETL